MTVAEIRLIKQRQSMTSQWFEPGMLTTDKVFGDEYCVRLKGVFVVSSNLRYFQPTVRRCQNIDKESGLVKFSLPLWAA